MAAFALDRLEALEEYGEEELQRLRESTVAVVGLGATGSVVAENLARSGIELVLIDRDYLEPADIYSSNLYTREQVENCMPKAEAALERLEDVGEVRGEVADLRKRNLDLLEVSDLVIDCTDNLGSRRLIDAWSHESGTPWVYTAAAGSTGCSKIFLEDCFNCLAGSKRSSVTCELDGLSREAAVRAASLSSEAARRYLSGMEVDTRLRQLDAPLLELDTEGCRVCREGGVRALEDHGGPARVCGEGKFQLDFDPDLAELSELENHPGLVASNDHLVRLETGSGSVALFRTGRAIVEAEGPEQARQRLSELGV